MAEPRWQPKIVILWQNFNILKNSLLTYVKKSENIHYDIFLWNKLVFIKNYTEKKEFF